MMRRVWMLLAVALVACEPNPVEDCVTYRIMGYTLLDCCETDDQCVAYYGDLGSESAGGWSAPRPFCRTPGPETGVCGECRDDADCLDDEECVERDTHNWCAGTAREGL